MSDLLAPAMFGGLVLAVLSGFPVAFALAAVAATFGLIGAAAGHFDVTFLQIMILRMGGVFANDNLLAVPMLILMGMVMERTGIAQDMFVALNRLFGRLPGGLAYTTVLVGAVLSAITGFVSASVVALGLIALPVMLRAGYEPRLASGVVTASATLAQVIPPSLVLIVLAEQLEVSLADIYRGALLPSAILVGGYMAYVFLSVHGRPERAPPAAPASGEEGSAVRPWLDASVAAGVPLVIVLTVLAAIYLGIAAPTEGGAIGVTATLLFGLARRRLTLTGLRQAMEVTANLTSGLIFLLLGASFFILVFRGLDGQAWVDGLLSSLPAGALGFVVALNLLVFFLAFFIEFFEIAFIVLPLVVPVARQLGIDMVWLTVLLAINLQTSFMHPPLGLAILNLRTVAPPALSTITLYRGALPFLGIQALVVALLVAAPAIVLKRTPATVDPAQSFESQLPPPPLLIEEL
ncbi:TRAP transporter large permease subunit [Roseomonas sp. KE2513]|uniref:TRAP transporter large permease n=1 Tax=Roseomonas sp. KE2513 TaxID=2479202 RepID=UPI0018E061E6|nr:TRAP transporter large permease subunit [Roseomonas sp. KE2513]MBI0539706.1 TRAP transporter large permease subunit [Roseomonas sp. KE2513]